MAAKLTIDVLSLFPDMVEAPLGGSILGKARDRGLLEIRCHNIRDWTTDKHRKTDDYLCGGGQGMLLKPEPIFAAVEELRRRETRVVLMTPQGRTFNQSLAAELAASGGHLIILCGHYEGVDHRVVEELVDMELSIGDYILTNGAIASVVVIDAVARLIPGVLGMSVLPWRNLFPTVCWRLPPIPSRTCSGAWLFRRFCWAATTPPLKNGSTGSLWSVRA